MSHQTWQNTVAKGKNMGMGNALREAVGPHLLRNTLLIKKTIYREWGSLGDALSNTFKTLEP